MVQEQIKAFQLSEDTGRRERENVCQSQELEHTQPRAVHTCINPQLYFAIILLTHLPQELVESNPHSFMTSHTHHELVK